MNLETELRTLAENVKTKAPPDVLATMQAANDKLAASGLAAGALKRGEKIPDFELPDATGKIVRSADLRAKGHLLISFYRGHWCPYCNLELKALQERLNDITSKGATLVAISPQTPDHSLTTQQKAELKFPVLSDEGNRVARKFGLVFTLDESLKPIYQKFGVDLMAHNGDASFELPMPATYLIGGDGTVLEAYVNTDYRERLSPEMAIEWLSRNSARP